MDILDDMGVSKLSAFFFTVNYSFKHDLLYARSMQYFSLISFRQETPDYIIVKVIALLNKQHDLRV